tara:strand:- start:500 stop:634 length:135 start_codon:yes stop_codon:yes gene_type:complete
MEMILLRILMYFMAFSLSLIIVLGIIGVGVYIEQMISDIKRKNK